MSTTTENTLSVATMSKAQEMKMQQVIKNWTQYSQCIALIMSEQMSELGLTQQLLAEKSELHTAVYIQHIEREENMSLETICKIENALNIEIIKGLNKIE